MELTTATGFSYQSVEVGSGVATSQTAPGSFTINTDVGGTIGPGGSWSAGALYDMKCYFPAAVGTAVSGVAAYRSTQGGAP